MAFNYLVISFRSLNRRCAFQFSPLSRSHDCWRVRAQFQSRKSTEETRQTEQEREESFINNKRKRCRRLEYYYHFVFNCLLLLLFSLQSFQIRFVYLFSCFYSFLIGSRDRRPCRRTRKPFGHPAMAVSPTTTTQPTPPPPPLLLLPFRVSIAPGR